MQCENLKLCHKDDIKAIQREASEPRDARIKREEKIARARRDKEAQNKIMVNNIINDNNK